VRHRGDPASWYWDALPAPPARGRLKGTLRCDVGIVGGGIAGISAALALAERGRRVVLLEARRLGAGASGRNGGQLLPGFAIEQAALRGLVGAADARRLWDLSVAAMDEVHALRGRHGIDCDFRPGHVQAALKPRHLAALVAWRDELEDSLEYPHAQLLDRDALQAQVRSARYVGGLLDRRAGHLDPLKYLRGLASAAEAAGATLHEDSRVLAYRVDAAGIHVRTADGDMHCGQLLLAGNAALGRVAPRLARRIIAVATDVIATEPLAPARAAEVLPGDVAVSDTNWVLDYFRLTPDRRLLLRGSAAAAAAAQRFAASHTAASVPPSDRRCSA
jgi:gamma-glutamylputrescine oxidase